MSDAAKDPTIPEHVSEISAGKDTSGIIEPKVVKKIAPALLGDDEDSNCECWPESEPCGIPDDTTSITSACCCNENCEHTEKVDKDSSAKKAQFNVNVIQFENTGKLQSPININLNDTVVKNFPALQFSSMHYNMPERLFIEQKDTYEVFLKYRKYASPRISGGPLKSPYKFLKFQFHWATEDGKGSEHTVNGKVFPLELHAIYIQEDLTKDTANSIANGYTILGYFFDINAEHEHPAVNILLENFERFDKMQLPKDQTPQLDIQRPFAIKDLIDTFSESYITYEGSMTEEPFGENVTWILAPYCIKISPAQLARFRALKRVKPNNFRERQDLHERVVNIVEREDNVFRSNAKPE